MPTGRVITKRERCCPAISGDEELQLSSVYCLDGASTPDSSHPYTTSIFILSFFRGVPGSFQTDVFPYDH
jgi:hypothetical protein